MKRTWISLLALGALVVSSAALEAPKNFIVIFADDFGFGDLGCYNELFRGDDAYSLADEFTPNLDKLGRDGIRFMQTYAASWCAPSRTTLLSGRWCNRADVVERPWIGKQLRDRGYATCFVGKSHGTISKGTDSNPATGGFNDALLYNSGMRKFYMSKGETLTRRSGFESDPFVAEGGEYITDLFTDFGADFIQRSAIAEKPVFLYLAYTAPHTPLDGKLEDLQEMFPGKFEGIEKEDWIELLNAKKSRDFEPMPPEVHKRCRQAGVRPSAPGWSKETSLAYQKAKALGKQKFNDYNFAALCYSMDRGVGRIMQTLKAAGVDKDTLVIFTSDNGTISGSNYPLENFKSSHFEGGIRVPMIFWSKPIAGSEASGRIVDEITPTTCIAPTLVGIVDNRDKPDFPFDGINLWPYLAQNRPVPDDRVYFWANSKSSMNRASGVYRDQQYRVTDATREFEGMKLGDLTYGDRDSICNVVYIKGKDKLVYWSTLDGKGKGATYKQLPVQARSFENPVSVFKEEVVQDGQFPEGGRGAEFFEEFVEYIQGAGADELRESAVFNGGDVKNLKPLRERVNIEN
jgi:arylsulfatase A-like enzyme